MKPGASGSSADSIPGLSFPVAGLVTPAFLSLISLMIMVTEAPQLEQAWPCNPFMQTTLLNTLSTYPNLLNLNLISMTFSDSDSDPDDNGEELDPISYLRYFTAGNPVVAQLVEEHDKKMREELNQRIVMWIDDVS